MIAQVLVGVADLAVRLEQYEQAARLLAASVVVRGQPDRSHPDAPGSSGTRDVTSAKHASPR